jgi:hypothetical protein
VTGVTPSCRVLNVAAPSLMATSNPVGAVCTDVARVAVMLA